MLTPQEKNDLYAVIVETFGEESSIKACKGEFNEQTIEIVERAINESVNCNRSMKELVIGLGQSSTFIMSGWLRKSMQKFLREMKGEKIRLKGYGCWAGTMSRWRSAIIASTY